MGLFDKLLNEGSKIVKEVASEENKEKVSKFFGDLKDSIEETTKEIASEENKEKVSKFFGDLKDSIEETTKEITSDENKEKVSQFFGDLKENISEWKEKGEFKSEELPQEYFEEDESGKSCREKLLEVLAEDFSKYTVRENVSPREIGGKGNFMNYSIAVYDGLTPVLFIMIIGKTTTSHREYRWSREEALSRGYQFINFIEHYPNNVLYIKDRLQKYL